MCGGDFVLGTKDLFKGFFYFDTRIKLRIWGDFSATLHQPAMGAAKLLLFCVDQSDP